MQVDTLVTNVQVFNAYVKRFIKGNAALLDGRFLYIGEKGAETFQAKEVIDGKGRYMIPGLIDIHLHIESTMVTPETFSYGLIKNGVTTIVSEPHEMANVFGPIGVKEMIRASRSCVTDIFYAIPSSVPSTPLETTGGSIELEDIEALLKEEMVVCLGEIMNYTEVITDPEGKTNKILRQIRQIHPDLIIEGHVPKLLDLDLSKVVFTGVDSDHTQQTVAGMEERIRAGMFLEIQEKSMTEEVINYLIDHDIWEHFCFVTDDVMADSFVKRGHLNHLLKKAIQMGMTPEHAIYACTFTPARRMQLMDRGCIAPNKVADFVLLSGLQEVAIDQVYKKGKKVYDHQIAYLQGEQLKQFPEVFYHSVKLARLKEEDFKMSLPVADGRYLCRIMMVSDGTTFTKEHHDTIQVLNQTLQWEDSEYGLIAVFERYGINGNRGYGLIGGDTIKRGAIATTYSHDNHNLLVVGRSVEDMLVAANQVIESQGGYCVVENGQVLANLHLPVGGILTEAPLETVAEDVEKLRAAMKSLGYKHYNPIMSLSTHSLPVSPELKITDLGLIRVNEGRLVPLFVNGHYSAI